MSCLFMCLCAVRTWFSIEIARDSKMRPYLMCAWWIHVSHNSHSIAVTINWISQKHICNKKPHYSPAKYRTVKWKTLKTLYTSISQLLNYCRRDFLFFSSSVATSLHSGIIVRVHARELRRIWKKKKTYKIASFHASFCGFCNVFFMPIFSIDLFASLSCYFCTCVRVAWLCVRRFDCVSDWNK